MYPTHVTSAICIELRAAVASVHPALYNGVRSLPIHCARLCTWVGSIGVANKNAVFAVLMGYAIQFEA